jgi:CelD/BcsL family acetyltransferase involved in cellulose biosynthesis
MELRVLSDLESFLAYGEAWDDLWHRSAAVLPTARADLIAHWVRHFAHQTRFRALVVAEGDRLLAGIPLVRRRIKGLFPAADLPINPWSPNGELLLDESTQAANVLQCLCQGIGQMGWPMLWIDTAPLQSFRWQTLISEGQKAGLSPLIHWRYPVGLVHWDDFSGYWAARPSGLRRKIRKCLRQLEEVGPIGVQEVRSGCPAGWAEALDRAWQIEDAGWKGVAGTSVLRCSGMREFYLTQTQLLAQWGYARLVFLEVGGRPIAFGYGWEAKGVLQVLKISYDPSFARFSPGHLLWYLWFQKLAEGRQPMRVDFLGPLTEGVRPWANGSYPIGRVIFPTNRMGKCLLAGYQAYRTCRGIPDGPNWLGQCTTPGPEEVEKESCEPARCTAT